MSHKKKCVLVTGGLGYIGSHTSIELLSSGYQVVIVDDLSNSDIEVREHIEQIAGKKVDLAVLDLKSEKSVQLLFQKFKFEGVIHFAASKSVSESTNVPLDYYENNLRSLVNILRQMNAHQVRNIVFSSSCTVYGQPEELPVTERTPLKSAESPYGNTKKIGEDIIRDATKAHLNMKAISLRYFNPIGAHSSGLIGERPKGIPNNLMPYLMQVATGEREVLSVYGQDYDTPDGTAIRDYVHVSDLACAHVLALDRMMGNGQKNDYEVFNLGSGSGYSVMEIIEAFNNANGVELNYQMAPKRPGDIEKIYSDNSFSKTELGWEPKFDLNSMMKTAWKWQEQLNKMNDEHRKIKPII